MYGTEDLQEILTHYARYHTTRHAEHLSAFETEQCDLMKKMIMDTLTTMARFVSQGPYMVGN